MTEENTTTGYTVTPDEAVSQPTPQPDAEAPNLGVQDLDAAAQIIDIAVARGAFRAGEAAQVGAVYNKMISFVNAVKAQQQAAEEAQAEASATQ